MLQPSLVIGGRSASLVITFFGISVNSAVSQVETSEAMASSEGVGQGGSSSINEAISIRASVSRRIGGAIPCPHQSLCGGRIGSLETGKFPPLESLFGKLSADNPRPKPGRVRTKAAYLTLRLRHPRQPPGLNLPHCGITS
ncbi:hypothetical protein ACC719_06530 [Rhizobium ruizarguesonis]